MHVLCSEANVESERAAVSEHSAASKKKSPPPPRSSFADTTDLRTTAIEDYL